MFLCAVFKISEFHVVTLERCKCQTLLESAVRLLCVLGEEGDLCGELNQKINHILVYDVAIGSCLRRLAHQVTLQQQTAVCN